MTQADRYYDGGAHHLPCNLNETLVDIVRSQALCSHRMEAIANDALQAGRMAYAAALSLDEPDARNAARDIIAAADRLSEAARRMRS